MIFIIEILNNIGDYKWLIPFFSILGPWVIYITKVWIENYNNIPLEKMLNSNLTNIYNEIFMIIITFVSMFFLLLLPSSGKIEEMVNDSSVFIVFAAFFIADVILTILVFAYMKIVLFFTKTKYDYFVLFDVKASLEWKLIKHSGKRGYLIRNDEGVIDFLQDITVVKFKEVKRPGIFEKIKHRKNSIRKER